jgi:hypothetical protein
MLNPIEINCLQIDLKDSVVTCIKRFVKLRNIIVSFKDPEQKISVEGIREIRIKPLKLTDLKIVLKYLKISKLVRNDKSEKNNKWIGKNPKEKMIKIECKWMSNRSTFRKRLASLAFQ